VKGDPLRKRSKIAWHGFREEKHMKLVGVYLSPYVRRVAAALISRGLPYEHEPVHGYREFERAVRYNPVGKVPSLVLDDGEILIDSNVIIDYVNELVPTAPLIPAGSTARRATLKLAAIGYGVAEQAIRLYGGRSTAAETDTKRWRAQIQGGLRALDEAARGPLLAKPLDSAAITAVVTVELLALLHPDIELLSAFPALAALAAEQRDAAPFAQTRPTL
jgi:glutathione S-transferase